MAQRGRHFIFLTQYYPPEPGAASIRLQAMAHELMRQGHHVSVVTAMPHHLGASGSRRFVFHVQEIVQGIPVIRTWIWRVPPNRRFWWRLLNYFSFVVTSFGGLRKLPRPDYLLVESPPLFLGMTARLYSRWFKVPYILSVSDLWPESAVALGLVRNPWLVGLTRRLELSLYAHAAYVSAVTEGIQQTIRETGQIPPERVLFFPNGVDLAQFPRVEMPTALRARWGKGTEKVFLYPGTMGYAQGLDVIIEAAKRLRDRTDIAFLLVGDGPVKAHLMEQVKAAQLTNVWFEALQPVENMPAYFSLARAVVVPLRRHSLFKGARPSKVFPAWSAQVPVIYVGEGEMADLIHRAKGGVVAEPENGDALAKAVLQLADMPEDAWTAMGQAGWSFVRDHYTWQRIAEKWLKSFEPGSDV
ncbi:glycosyltransferase WbuB [Sulfobacillus thermotolerans]|uniref:Glycosyltransferase WbuB n=1 Tax=Sulfobacillus thermotolerans TaxID=338644 RepID=A0ABM6RUE8_9FIRM|nr:glycosyltransferase WbuB [Sulfobacillus thermotolerans]